MISYPAIFQILGWVLLFFGMAMHFPALTTYFAYGDDIAAFFQSGIVASFSGLVMIFMTRGCDRNLGHKDAFLLTFLVWVTLSFVGAMPFYISGTTDSFVDAFFESTSGLTTTGATVLSGLDTMHHGILLWRSMLQWFGGMGIIVLATAIMPFLGVGGMQLYKAEMPGVEKDKLQPRLKETAALLWGVYMLLTLACFASYVFAGMGAFDAICHSFTTVATAGYSTRDASIGFYDSAAIETVAIVFMLLGAVNFTLHYVALSRWDFRGYIRDHELRVYGGLVALAVTIVSITLILSHEYPVMDSIRHAAFNVVSIMTTTGYATQDYNAWYVLAPMILLASMFLGGCAGSTSGGMKVMRVLVIFKHGQRELSRLIHPRGVMHVKASGRVVPDHVLQAIWSFAGLYIFCFIGLSIILTTYGIDMVTAFSAVAAAITSVGPGLGDVGPASNYGWLPDGAKMLLTFSMFLGRLELFTLLVLITPEFWRK